MYTCMYSIKDMEKHEKHFSFIFLQQNCFNDLNVFESISSIDIQRHMDTIKKFETTWLNNFSEESLLATWYLKAYFPSLEINGSTYQS